jgi:hypothetical protein
MKTKIKNFMQVLTLHSVSFVIVFAVGFTALGAWNWSTRVNSGDTLTAEKWNAIVAQLEAVEQKASNAEAKAVTADAKATTAQNTANVKADKSYVDNKVSTANTGYGPWRDTASVVEYTESVTVTFMGRTSTTNVKRTSINENNYAFYPNCQYRFIKDGVNYDSVSSMSTHVIIPLSSSTGNHLFTTVYSGGIYNTWHSSISSNPILWDNIQKRCE